MKSQMTNSQKYSLIFFSFLMVRILFIIITGYDNYELSVDSARYNELSNQVLKGNFNLDIGRFIVAPFFPYFMALIKFVFGSYWEIVLSTIQLLTVSLTGVCVYKMSNLLFNNRFVSNIATLLYCFFPLTLWWSHTFGQEAFFQCFLIFSIYFLVKTLKNHQTSTLILSAVFFSLCFLTKSHVLLFAPFIVLTFLLNKKLGLQKRLKMGILYGVTCLLFTIPYGIYNLKTNGVYTLSSNGVQMFFWVGHNDDFYTYVVNTPERGSPEYKRLQSLELGGENREELNELPHAQKQKEYANKAIQWIKENPDKTLELAFNNARRFIVPGLSIDHYPFKQWLIIFLISLPIYLLAYFGIISGLVNDYRKHFWILGLFLSMLLFSVVFYAQNRFRTITIEPFYLIYAAYGIYILIQKIKLPTDIQRKLGIIKSP